MKLRDFSLPGASGVPTIVDAPYAGHTSTAADFDKDKNLVGTLRANGCQRILLTDWKPATIDMKDFDVDTYLAEINVVVDDLGGRVNLVGLCQGGCRRCTRASRRRSTASCWPARRSIPVSETDRPASSR